MSKQIAPYSPNSSNTPQLPKGPKIPYIATFPQNHSIFTHYKELLNKPLSHTCIKLPHTTPSPFTIHFNRVLFFPLKNMFNSIVTWSTTLWSENHKEENHKEEYQRKDSRWLYEIFSHYENGDIIPHFKSLIKKGININAKDEKQENALCAAIFILNMKPSFGSGNKTPNLDLVTLLLENQANVNVVAGSNDPFPLSMAISLPDQPEQHQLIKLLIENKANVNYVENGTPLIIRATNEQKWGAVEILLNNGADIEVRDNEGRTPLHLVAERYYGHQIAQQLINIGIGSDMINACDNEGRTPLHLAIRAMVQNDNPSIGCTTVINAPNTKLLIKTEGVNINACDKKGRTPLHYAVSDISNIWGHRNKTSPKEIAYHEKISYSCAELLIEQRAEVDARDNQDHTPLYYAALHGNTKCAELLIEKGADIKLLDNNVIILAAKKGYWNAVKLLIEQGAPLDGHDENHNNLMLLAVQSSKTEVVKLLFNAAYSSSNDKKLSYHEENNNGVTPLFAAIQLGNLKMVKLIIAKAQTIPSEDIDQYIKSLESTPEVRMLRSLESTKRNTKSAMNTKLRDINTQEVDPKEKEAVQEEEDGKSTSTGSDTESTGSETESTGSETESTGSETESTGSETESTGSETESSEESTVLGQTSSDTS